MVLHHDDESFDLVHQPYMYKNLRNIFKQMLSIVQFRGVMFLISLNKHVALLRLRGTSFILQGKMYA